MGEQHAQQAARVDHARGGHPLYAPDDRGEDRLVRDRSGPPSRTDPVARYPGGGPAIIYESAPRP